MKKQIFTLMLSVTIFTTNPLWAMNSEESLAALDKQISHVKPHVKNLPYVRFIWGVSNTIEKNSLFKNGSIVQNEQDVLFDTTHTPGVLPHRTITNNYNDLDALKKIAEEFENTADVITTDLSTTKFAFWTKDHLIAFKRMLKKGGLLFIPLDGGKIQVTEDCNTKEELFEAGSKENQLKTGITLISSSEVLFYHLPGNLPILFNAEMETEMNKQIEKYKSLRPSFSVSTEQEQFDMQDKLAELGLNQNLAYKDNAIAIIYDDEKVKELARQDIIKNAKKPLMKQLELEFIEQVLIPQHWKRIVGEVFYSQKIIIQKNLPLPQPHQHPTLSNSYAISVTK